MLRRSLVIHNWDNVAVLLEKAEAGDFILYKDEEIKLLQGIEFGHKIALKDLAKEDSIFKYGEAIGYMMEDVLRGTWIHNHNMGCRRGK